MIFRRANVATSCELWVSTAQLNRWPIRRFPIPVAKRFTFATWLTFVWVIEKPTGFVRRFGVSNIAVNVQRESGANVIAVMDGLKAEVKRLNEGVLARNGLVLNQVYDETDYINSAVGLVQQNIILGRSFDDHRADDCSCICVAETLIFVPLLGVTALAAVFVSPWFFLITLALVFVAGVWFARGTLVVGLAIPVSIIGTFLILNGLGSFA